MPLPQEPALSSPPSLLASPSSGRRLSIRCARKLAGSMLAAPLLWALTATTTLANEGSSTDQIEPPKWFQIELLVFTQPNAPLTDEYWNEQLQPAFDNEAILLLPEGTPQRPNTALWQTGQVTDPQPATDIAAETTRPVIPSEHATLSSLNARRVPELYRQLYPYSPDHTPVKTDADSQSPTNQTPKTLPETYANGAFALLSKEQRKPPVDPDTGTEPTNTAAKPELKPINLNRLQRNGHRILFYGHWRQPVLDREQSRSVIIRGGNALDEAHFELEGDLRISLNRYLHLWPQLYLTRQLPQDWHLRDPKTIRTLASAQLPLLEAQTLSQAQFSTRAFLDSTVNNQSLYSATADQYFRIETGTRPLNPTPAFTDLPFTDPGYETPEPSTEQPPASQYLRVQLNQPRRMRSGELHYLDHPMFGLLIRITPYELPVAEAVFPPELLPASPGNQATNTPPAQ